MLKIGQSQITGESGHGPNKCQKLDFFGTKSSRESVHDPNLKQAKNKSPTTLV